MYIEMTQDDIKEDIIWVSQKQLMKDTGVPRTTLHRHITKNIIDAYKFRNRTFFKPESAHEYAELFKKGLC